MMQVRNLVVCIFISSLPLFSGTTGVVIDGGVGNLTCPGTSTCDITVKGTAIVDGMLANPTSAGVSTTYGYDPTGYPDLMGPNIPPPWIQAHVTAWNGSYPYTLDPWFKVSGTLDVPSSWGNILIDGYVRYTEDFLSQIRSYGDYVNVNGQSVFFNAISDNRMVISHTPGDPFTLSYLMAHPFGATGPGGQVWFSFALGAAPAPTPEPSTALLAIVGAIGIVFFGRKVQRSAKI